jgi:glycosyltransferase involved in cell wall biosynthesis
MKILFYSPHPTLYLEAPTGYGSHMRGMIRGFQEEGHTVEVLIMGKAPIQNSSSPQPSVLKSFAKIFIPKILWRTLKEFQQIRFDKYAAKELQNAIEFHQPDIVYERSAWMSNGSADMLSNFNIKHIVEINAPFEEEVKSFENAHSFLASTGKNKLKNLLQSASLVLPITSSLQTYLIERYKLNPNKCVVVPNAIEKQEIQINKSRVAAINKQFNLSEVTVLGFVGSIFPYHGVDRLIRGVSKLKYTDIAILVVGDGYLIPELKKLANELGISSRVYFTGSVPKEDIYNYISAMDILTLPNTEWYCSPVKLFEYGAFGKTILAVNEAGVSDVMSNEEGLLFKNNDSAFQDALLAAITDVDALKIKALNFQQKVFEKHTWRANAQKVIQQINSAQ